MKPISRGEGLDAPVVEARFRLLAAQEPYTQSGAFPPRRVLIDDGEAIKVSGTDHIYKTEWRVLDWM
ncbi:uncharacterized protein N7477_006078 [Penicillium maclennaniae]|uniref:uncharacterized protein n=1 Tax=Penicillium maclennaniae TaxID=1343394 RepID=UPI0025403707|nr:uncharacterized protein N7477_006078 [Penicillium maclennaniae]KAJ5670715.1 hypothetical protein N7477_006078 [Penicillium maclennaniae]